jgi:hypothetical protein
MPQLLAAARYLHVALKATGVPNYSAEPDPCRDIHGDIKQRFAACGPQRLFWGADITRMPCSGRQCVTPFTEELLWLKGRDLAQVMGRDWINWQR